MEHIKNKTVNLTSVSTVVIDEVDTMLDMGFFRILKKFYQMLDPKNYDVWLTMNQNVKNLHKSFNKIPVNNEVTKQKIELLKLLTNK